MIASAVRNGLSAIAIDPCDGARADRPYARGGATAAGLCDVRKFCAAVRNLSAGTLAATNLFCLVARNLHGSSSCLRWHFGGGVVVLSKRCLALVRSDSSHSEAHLRRLFHRQRRPHFHRNRSGRVAAVSAPDAAIGDGDGDADQCRCGSDHWVTLTDASKHRSGDRAHADAVRSAFRDEHDSGVTLY